MPTSSLRIRASAQNRVIVHHTILGEKDGGASWNAILSCTDRWRGGGRKVSIAMPTVGKDFADVWAQAGIDWRDHVVTVRMPI